MSSEKQVEQNLESALIGVDERTFEVTTAGDVNAVDLEAWVVIDRYEMENGLGLVNGFSTGADEFGEEDEGHAIVPLSDSSVELSRE